MSGVYEQEWHGVEVEEEQRDGMVDECVQQLLNGERDGYTFVATGDTLIVAFDFHGDGIIEWNDCVIRRRGSIPLPKKGRGPRADA